MGYQYAERVGPGLLDEPWNTVTNASFLVAAWSTWTLARPRGDADIAVKVLIALLVTIGLGSALFHMFANEWSRWLDIVPILLFQLAALWLYVRRVAGGRNGAALLAVSALVATGPVLARWPAALNGSLMYAGAWASLVVTGVYHRSCGKPEPWTMVAAAAVFTLSLLFRSIDKTEFVRTHSPHGSHFLWHILNGTTLYLTCRALLAAETRLTSGVTALDGHAGE